MYPCEDIAQRLNRDCLCVSVERDLLLRQLQAAFGGDGAAEALLAQRPHLFAEFGVFVSQRQIDAMAQLVAAVQQVVELPVYRDAALQWAPTIARHDVPASGVLFGYDFHLDGENPRLVEINTNAGGALLNVALARAQIDCCKEVRDAAPNPSQLKNLDEAIFSMFVGEWKKARGAAVLTTIAIVDDNPAEQYLYPEFLLFQQLFERNGITASIVDANTLELRAQGLYANGQLVDLVYNRLTDFDLDAPEHAVLRAAYLSDAVVLTPHPRAHALYADKRNLTLLSDENVLRSWSVDESIIEILSQGIPRTVLVTAENADALWRARRQLFFKPATGYGSRAVYRGDKLTRRVWGEILAGNYVAQALVMPSERRWAIAEQPFDLKVDVRNYVYDGRVYLLAARLYQGQTTNFRTAGGGFAPVYAVPCVPGLETGSAI